MEKTIKLYTYVDGTNDTPFPSKGEQVISQDFTYEAKRMGSAPSISFTFKHRLCLDDLWTESVYATFNGEKYYLKQTPTSSYDNTDTRYKHEVELVSERIILDNVYFYDVVDSTEENDKPVSNSSNVVFFGTITEFAKRLNQSLQYAKLQTIDDSGNYVSGYRVVVDSDIEETEGELMSFENQFFSDVLQELYNTYETPYYFVGKEIHIGYTDSLISHTFKYGVTESLLSITKTNANNKIVNRATGYGSADNIPYYYPNDSERGDLGAFFRYAGAGTSYPNIVSIVNAAKFARCVNADDYVEFVLSKGEGSFVADSFLYSVDGYNYSPYNNNASDIGQTLTGTFHYSTDVFTYLFKRDIKITRYDNFRIPLTITFETTNATTNLYPNANWNFQLIDKATGALYSNNKIEIYNDETTNNPMGIELFGVSEGEYTLQFQMPITPPTDYLGYYAVSLKMGALTPSMVEAWYNATKDKYYTLSDLGLEKNFDNDFAEGDTITQRVLSYINPQTNLMPPTYRESKGSERFYNALNDTYVNPNSESGEYYTFENPYVVGKPKEHIEEFEDIKPTIKEIVNANGYRIDMFTEFAYDLNDSDETEEADDGTQLDYIHPYFFGKLRKFDGEHGFNLFDHTIEESEMTVSVTSGSCGACNWIIGVTEDTQKNTVQVDENGDLLRDANGNVKFGEPQDRQNDTRNYEVWVALKKEYDTFGVIMPNATNNYKPKACTKNDNGTYNNDGDTFVLLHIDLPKAYILAAEERLKEAIIEYMAENNSEKFNFSISFSRIFLENNPTILSQLSENSQIKIVYNNVEYTIYVSSFSYKMQNDAPLPEISVELSDELTITKNVLDKTVQTITKTIKTNAEETEKAIQKVSRKAPSGATSSGGTTTTTATSISDIVTTYQLSDSGTKVPTGYWSTTPFTRKGKYLWSRMAIQLSTGAVRYHYTVAYQGEDATGDVPTPNFVMQVESSQSVIWSSVFTDTSAEGYIVYVKDIQAFAHRKSGTNELYVNFVTKDVVTADYQVVEGTTATVHTDKTFVRKNTNELYVFNATMGLKQINSEIKIQ